jgi:hypothetical protein
LLLALVVLVASLGAGVLLRGPALLKARVVAAATEHGVTLNIDRVDPTGAGLVLRGVKASLVGCPSIHVSADEVSVTLDRFGSAQLVSLSGYDVTVSGGLSGVAAEVAAWRAASHAPLAIEAKAGHLAWSATTIPTLTIEALDVTASVATSPEGTITLDTSSLLVNVPRGHAGPWHAHLQTSRTETRARIGLDLSNPDAPPSAMYVERPLEGATWTVDLPRASSFKIGIPSELLGLTSDLSLEAAVHSHVEPAGALLAAEGHVGVYGLQISTGKGAKVPVDVVVGGKLAGDPSKPLALSGATLSFGKATSAVTGKVALAGDGVRIEIDRASTRAESLPPLTLDTREWTGPAASTPPLTSSPAGPGGKRRGN